VNVKTKLIVLAFLVLATALEVSGDAIVRRGLAQRLCGMKALYFGIGSVLLFGYGLSLNLAPLPFHRVVGIYIATLFVVWQVVSFIAFRSVPTMPMIFGGSLIVIGGLVVAFWKVQSA